jgi:hypothetical protein
LDFPYQGRETEEPEGGVVLFYIAIALLWVGILLLAGLGWYLKNHSKVDR